MAVGNTPVNQLNALPLINAAAVVTPPSEQVIIGGNVVRSWNATSLGLNGVQRVNDGVGGSNLFGPFLDMRGMNSGSLVVVRSAAAAGIDATGMSVYFLYRISGFGNQPSNNLIGAYSKQVAGFTWNATPAIGNEIAALGWTNSSVPIGVVGQPLVMSADVFLVLHFAVANNVQVNFTVQLYAQSN